MRAVNALTLGGRVNIVGVLSSLLLLYVCLSGKPWWVLVGGREGENMILVKLSPFTFYAEILRRPVVVPIIPYLNLAAELALTLTAVAMLAGSFVSRKPWSKPLVGLGGFFVPVVFLVGLVVSLRLTGSYLKVDIPIVGESTIIYTIESIKAQIPLSSMLTTEYYTAVVAGALSLLAKVLHSRIQT